MEVLYGSVQSGAAEMVMRQGVALMLMLRRFGFPRVTPETVIDGRSVCETLRVLQAQIDEFLAAA